jgi:hypothetical protein
VLAGKVMGKVVGKVERRKLTATSRGRQPKTPTTQLPAPDLAELTECWEKDRDITALRGLIEAGVWPEDFLNRIRQALATYIEKGTNPRLADLLASGPRRGRLASPRTRTLHLRSRDAIDAVLVGVRRAGWTGRARFERAEAWFAEQGTALGGYAAKQELQLRRVQYLHELYYHHRHKRPLTRAQEELAALAQYTIPRGPDRPDTIIEPDPSRPGWRWMQFATFDPVTERWPYSGRVAVGPVRTLRKKSH